jgi:hypothetical protein
VGPNFIIDLPEFLFILVRSLCKNLRHYDNPFWGFEQQCQPWAVHALRSDQFRI